MRGLSAARKQEAGVLSLTDTAVTTMKRLTALSKLPETTGLRIAAGRSPAEGLAVEFAAEAGPKDEIHDVHGVRVFVDPAVTALLERISLDFEISPAGRFTFCFIIRPWPPEVPAPAADALPDTRLAPRRALVE